jgi:hypothetical protein
MATIEIDRQLHLSLCLLVGAAERRRESEVPTREPCFVISAVLGAWHDATMTSRLVRLACV